MTDEHLKDKFNDALQNSNFNWNSTVEAILCENLYGDSLGKKQGFIISKTQTHQFFALLRQLRRIRTDQGQPYISKTLFRVHPPDEKGDCRIEPLF